MEGATSLYVGFHHMYTASLNKATSCLQREHRSGHGLRNSSDTPETSETMYLFTGILTHDHVSTKQGLNLYTKEIYVYAREIYVYAREIYIYIRQGDYIRARDIYVYTGRIDLCTIRSRTK